MRFSAPQRSTAWASMIPIAIAVVAYFVPLPFDHDHIVWLAVGGYATLAAGCLFRGL